MTTATEQSGIDLARAAKLHRTDLRARQIIDMCVAHALNESPERATPECRRFGRDMAMAAVATLLRYIYDDDGEINRLALERDHYKRLAEETLRFAPPSVVIASITGAASVDTLPKGQDAKQGLAGTEGSAVAATSGETPND